ncbi:MAG: ATP-binding cassette domain-containing protein [Oscillospiraceae bacterium]|jgi:ribose transport system ATP-binding protein|nr:ATP-binding cassette domain-containing protein [Oscillospiraceae bacterium]
MAEPILEAQSLFKQFGEHTALYNVSLGIFPGEIHAVLGLSGAGKTLLCEILSGAHRPGGGSLLYNGKTVRFRGAYDAIRRGITALYQNHTLIEQMTVSENVFLSRESSSLGFVNRGNDRKRLRKLDVELGYDIPPYAPVETLTGSQKRITELYRAVCRNARVLLVDEITTDFGYDEAEKLYSTLARLRDGGTAVVFFTNAAEEAVRIADRVTVLRSGEVAATLSGDEITVENALAYVRGDGAGEEYGHARAAESGNELTAEGLVSETLSGVSFTARGGEVLGIGGLDSSGRNEILSVICGAEERYAGRVSVNGRKVRKSVRAGIRAGIYYGAADRESPERMYIPDAEFRGTVQSGKVPAPGVLLLNRPTSWVSNDRRGEIRRQIRSAAERGLAVVLATPDFTELSEFCDRVILLRRGKIAADLRHGEFAAADLYAIATGKDDNAK